ncbi:Fe-S cluster assembly protein SufD [Dokdonella soli]|uniref:Fe-S cluster assembly protein SufD n=1 Tax=Dokdonella soli TaxID=529810 RepID=A0ABP3TN61_9GAMM
MASALLESLLGERVADASAVRREAVTALLRDGLPGARDEAWKYTSLRALEQRRYRDGDADAATRAINTGAFMLPEVAGARLVFVNGVFRRDLSVAPAQLGLTIEALSEHPDAFASTLRGAPAGAETRADAFVRLNTALAADGILLRVAGGTRVAEPVHLVFAGAAADTDIAWQARALIELGEGAVLTLVEHHIGASPNAHLGNLVAHYAIAAGARLDLVQIQDAAEAATLIRRNTFRLDRNAALSAHTIETGAQTMRHDFRVDLAGRGARFDSRGVFALRGRQHADTHLVVDHNARDTTCDIVWRGVADQRARGVFHGAITVAEGADGADAQLSNKNLLLSPLAEIDTQPVLEIYADEVKAAHGATVGQLDERALFYMRSRGVPLDAARRILVSAFCGAVISGIEPAALRERIGALLAASLPQAEALS